MSLHDRCSCCLQKPMITLSAGLQDYKERLHPATAHQYLNQASARLSGFQFMLSKKERIKKEEKIKRSSSHTNNLILSKPQNEIKVININIYLKHPPVVTCLLSLNQSYEKQFTKCVFTKNRHVHMTIISPIRK